jgi:hypothetical protein
MDIFAEVPMSFSGMDECTQVDGRPKNHGYMTTWSDVPSLSIFRCVLSAIKSCDAMPS